MNLDHGHVRVPISVLLPALPRELLEQVQWALMRVLHPHNPIRDYVFQGVPEHEGQIGSKSNEMKDCEIRAVFLCLFMVLLGDYQHYVTVIRFFPLPQFYFNTVSEWVFTCHTVYAMALVLLHFLYAIVKATIRALSLGLSIAFSSRFVVLS